MESVGVGFMSRGIGSEMLTCNSSKPRSRVCRGAWNTRKRIMRVCKRCTTRNAVSHCTSPYRATSRSADEAADHTEEAQRLRDTLLDRDHEIRALQAGAEAHAADEDKVSCLAAKRLTRNDS